MSIAGAQVTTSIRNGDYIPVDNGGPLNVYASASTIASYIQSGGTASITASLTGAETDAITGAAGQFLVSQSTIANLFGATSSIYLGSTTAAITGTSLVTISNATGFVALTSASLVAALTVHLPASPVDKQVSRFSFDQSVTSLTVTTTGSATMRGNTFSGTQSNQGLAFFYNNPNTSWYRFS